MALPDEENVTKPLIVAVVLVALATASVVLRFISRRVKKVAYGVDDWTIVFALVVSSRVYYSVFLILEQFWTYAQLGLQTASMTLRLNLGAAEPNTTRYRRRWSRAKCV
jgi:hypothetical protein